MERRGAGGENDRRVKRVEREVREVIARYLLTGFRGELSGLVSVSRVTMAGDLRAGRVFVSVMGDPGDAEASLEEIKGFVHEIQSEVDKQLKMKFCPKLTFFLDESMEHVLKVEKILRDISAKNAADTPEGDRSDSAPGGDDKE